MLAPERQTPRPRPPARIRRSTSKGRLLSSESAPPPPYAYEFPYLQADMESDASDPVAATAKMMGIDLDTALDMPAVTEQDVSNKSKAELTDLFLQAEKIIKAREQELNVAANLGKSLLETNEALKLRHDALLARLPAMQTLAASTSRFKPPRSDAWTTDDDVTSPASTFSRMHSRSNSIISNPRGAFHSRSNSIISLAPEPRRGHVRRISASPSALHALSETNAELIAELTRLHGTTDVAQIEGAQRLRKLEREIGGLRAELEATQRTNLELEEKVKEKIDEDRKREREERVRRLRDGDDCDSVSGESVIRDFAPPGNGVETWDSVVTPRIKRVSSPVHSESELEQSDREAGSVPPSSAGSSRTESQNNTPRPGEYALVAQLYRKVVELQEANSELSARNRVTNRQLAHAEREALEIKELYDAIGEEFAADQEDSPAGTIRASPREMRDGSVKSNSWSFRLRGDPFANDGRHAKRGSYGSVESQILQHGMRLNKSRAPLTDTLFSPPPDSPSPSKRGRSAPSVVLVPASPRPRSKLKPKLKGKMQPQISRSPLLPSRGSLALRRNYSTGSGSSASSRSSATSSFLGASIPRRNRGRRSLGSELGSEFGDDWDGMPSDNNRSLFDDESIRAFSDAETETGVYADTEEEDPALAALRDALTPPLAGRLLEQDEHILPIGSLQYSPGDAFHLVAHAVNARPTCWLESDDRRVRGSGPRASLTPAPAGEDPWETTCYPDIDPATVMEAERASVRMRRRDRALGRMESTAHARSASSSGLLASASKLQTVEDGPRRGLVESIKRASVDVLIELWIILQFVVVIATFLYTMGRRGPREVLGAPPRRS